MFHLVKLDAEQIGNDLILRKKIVVKDWLIRGPFASIITDWRYIFSNGYFLFT